MATPQPQTNGTEILSHVYGMVEAFKAFDSDNDGLITLEELDGLMSSLGYNPSKQEVQEMMSKGDTDKDGLLSLEEFLVMNTSEMNAGGLVDLLHAALPGLGLDGDVAVTGEELFDVLSGLGDVSLEQCVDIIASMDADGDGAVNVEDIRVIVQALL